MTARDRAGGRQRGVALIMALLVVALASITATAMISRQVVDIHRTANVGNGDRLWMYALGGEELAVAILQSDAVDGAVDHANETWAVPIPPMEIENGFLNVAIEDLQGRFNLNNLVRANAVNAGELQRFRRLLASLEIEPEKAYAVIDWIDGDIDPSAAAGAEDDIYLESSPAYRAANAMFVSPTELRLVHGLDDDDRRALLPHVAALPQETPVNINTASARQLMTLADGMTDYDAEILIEGRGESGYEDLESFVKSGALAGRQVDSRHLAVSTSYFLSTIRTEIGNTRMTLTSLLHRGPDGKVTVLMRSRGGY